MDSFKIEHFRRENPSRRFPQFRTLDATECASLRVSVAVALGLSEKIEPLAILNILRHKSIPMPEIDAEADEFLLSDLIRSLGITVDGDVFINWEQFDRIDQIDVQELSSHFDDIYYPGPDDIEIFDISMRWFLLVNHEGEVSVCRL